MTKPKRLNFKLTVDEGVILADMLEFYAKNTPKHKTAIIGNTYGVRLHALTNRLIDELLIFAKKTETKDKDVTNEKQI